MPRARRAALVSAQVVERAPDNPREKRLGTAAQAQQIEATVTCRAEDGVGAVQRAARRIQKPSRQGGSVRADGEREVGVDQRAPQDALDPRTQVSVALCIGFDPRDERESRGQDDTRPLDRAHGGDRVLEKGRGQERRLLLAHVRGEPCLDRASDGRFREDANATHHATVGRSTTAPPQLDPAPAVHPKQCRPTTIARCSSASRSKSRMWAGARASTPRPSIWLKSQS